MTQRREKCALQLSNIIVENLKCATTTRRADLNTRQFCFLTEIIFLIKLDGQDTGPNKYDASAK